MISITVIIPKIMNEERKLRKLLKTAADTFISVKKAAQILNVDKKTAQEILIYLNNIGYIESAGFEGVWLQSLRGKLFVCEKIKKEFRIETQKSQLNNLTKRIEIVRHSAEYPYYVDNAIITTQYPIEHKSEGVSIAYSLKAKGWPDEERDKAESQLRERHKGAFNNIVEYPFYPNLAIRLFLKSRSPVLKLKEYNPEKMQEIDGHRLI